MYSVVLPRSSTSWIVDPEGGRWNLTRNQNFFLTYLCRAGRGYFPRFFLGWRFYHFPSFYRRIWNLEKVTINQWSKQLASNSVRSLNIIESTDCAQLIFLRINKILYYPGLQGTENHFGVHLWRQVSQISSLKACVVLIPQRNRHCCNPRKYSNMPAKLQFFLHAKNNVLHF